MKAVSIAFATFRMSDFKVVASDSGMHNAIASEKLSRSRAIGAETLQ
jgi:hypothetical protein